IILNNKKEIVNLENQLKGENRSAYRNDLMGKINNLSQLNKLKLNFYIWGHSLDVSDKDYIIDLFYFNNEIDQEVRITVYYFDKNAKFALLNNLLDILGKEKVEIWMKNRWLKFQPNPNIAEINNIEPVALPKFR
ncbi:hypothetical protein I6M70_15035, partial [Acinetobacter pittii]|nr:hypothetical protein [Acinetobacter pittii]